MATLEADKFLEDLSGKHAKHYFAVLQDMLVALAMGNRPQMADARKRLEEVITETMGVAEVLGATLTLQKAAGLIPEEAQFASVAAGEYVRWKDFDERFLLTFKDTPVQTILPRVTLTEAVQDMVDRVPATIRDAAQRTARNIAKLYGTPGSGGVPQIAFVRSAEHAVTERVQGLIKEAIEKGIPELDFMRHGEVIKGAGSRIVDAVNEIRKRTKAWTKDYAAMAFRTNVNTAVTAGRFRQVQDPDIKAVIPCFMFDPVGDSDTRPNHMAGKGRILKVDNPLWARLSPPLGYR